MKVLVTGGAGYIASHTAVDLLENGHDIVVVDNLVNASATCVERVKEITGKSFEFLTIDLCDAVALKSLFEKYKFEAVIHFAALKAVGKSIELPLSYYNNNLTAALNLLTVMSNFGVHKFIFSSSATVYGKVEKLPLNETHSVGVGITNPYGKTKYFIEEMLKDLYTSNPKWDIVMLRYFNPVGAHKSGLIGEDPKGIPNNLMPFVSQVAVGKLAELNVFGDDYPTHDGTGVRDYIHILDLSAGHLAALDKLKTKCGLKIYNLGTGKGYSVYDMVHAFEKASGKQIKCKVLPRRPGDLPTIYADASLAKKELNWEAKRGIEEMCEDLWRWQTKNPNGFQ